MEKTIETKEIDAGLVEYDKFLKGLAMMGEALTTISADGDNSPIKLIMGRITAGIVVNGDDIAMLRFAVENDDKSLEKLTAEVTKVPSDAANQPVSE